ncbi:MAG: ribonuclease H-like domain-containing protein [Candidatus Andersenbacteria bacterium]|nr:ribonuclease H-like domain-containing protein [Candidatus Andersenbacteria bacterium]MBI3250767.1 ribonuclease H-like domain-containing protein [Candidatus Andersenbacteria bacterium]
MGALIIDIETVGETFADFDDRTKAEFLKYVKAKPGTPEYEAEVAEAERNLVFSPLTGQIVAIGVLDADKNKAVVYFQAPGADLTETKEDNVTYKPLTEEQMLESFWGGATRYSEFVTWNGRTFDIPYINIRSAIHHIPIGKDLMSNRYLGSQRYEAKHIDLFDQVSYYGAVRRPGGLHMWCRAFGIETPKDGNVAASEVGKAFADGKYLDIARYNARDLFATRELYTYWRQYLRTG